MAPSPPSPGSRDSEAESREDRVVGILQACLETIDNHTRALVDRACREHPDQADAVRRRIDALQVEGLAGSCGPISGDVEAASARSAGEDLPEEHIGPFRLLKELGRGGQAVVYLAEDTRLHRRVALKVLQGIGPVPESVLKRFRREAEVASKLDHPGICAVYDAGEESGFPYIAMRYVEGVTLAERISRAREHAGAGSSGSTTRAEILDTVAILEKAARALHAAHEAGVIHRDVKPRNIMVTPEGEPVLLDFGLAGISTGEGADLTRTGEVFGTPAYMSPEQVEARRRRLDRRTDVYSLGATLYECVTLAPPFDAPTREGLYRAVRLQDPMDPRRRNPRIPADLKVVLQATLEKDRERRYATAQDLAEDLRRVREGKPVTARPVSAAGRLVRWARRRPARAALVITLALGLPVITALAGFIIANRPAILAAENAKLRERVEQHLEKGYFALGNEYPPSAIPRFEAALALEPNCVEAVGGKAMALLMFRKNRTQQCHECLALLDRKADLVRANPGLLGLRVRALRKLGQATEAARLESRIPEPDSALDFFLEGSRTEKGVFRKEDLVERDRESYRRAVDAFSLAVLTAPRSRPLYNFRHAHAAGMGRDESSAHLAAETLTLQWKDTHVSWRIVGLALRYFDPKKAVDAFGKVLALRPDTAWVHHLRGILFCDELNQLDRAVEDFRKVLTFEPDNTDAHYHLGVALGKKDLEEEAISCFKEALRLDPEHFRAHFNLGSGYYNLGLVEKAIPHMEEAAKLQPDHFGAHRNLGRALLETGRVKEANQAFKKAVALNPVDVEALYGLGMTYHNPDQLAEAIATYRKVIKIDPNKIDPNHASVLMNLGRALDATGQQDEAMEAYREAIALDPDLAEAHFHLGLDLMQRGEFIQALRSLRRGHALGSKQQGWNPSSANRVRDCEKAVLRAVLREGLEPNDTGERILVARLLARYGCHANAARTWQEAFASDSALEGKHRPAAARSAALAGCGKGRDGKRLDGEERTEWRRQARVWLQQSLDAWKTRLDKGTLRKDAVVKRLQSWKKDRGLAGIRDAAALAGLPAQERNACEAFWKAVNALLAKTDKKHEQDH